MNCTGCKTALHHVRSRSGFRAPRMVQYAQLLHPPQSRRSCKHAVIRWAGALFWQTTIPFLLGSLRQQTYRRKRIAARRGCLPPCAPSIVEQAGCCPMAPHDAMQCPYRVRQHPERTRQLPEPPLPGTCQHPTRSRQARPQHEKIGNHTLTRFLHTTNISAIYSNEAKQPSFHPSIQGDDS